MPCVDILTYATSWPPYHVFYLNAYTNLKPVKKDSHLRSLRLLERRTSIARLSFFLLATTLRSYSLSSSSSVHFHIFFSYSHIFTSAIVGIIKFLISRSSSSSLITITRVSRPQISVHLSLSIPFLYFFYLLLGTSPALALEYHEWLFNDPWVLSSQSLSPSPLLIYPWRPLPFFSVPPNSLGRVWGVSVFEFDFFFLEGGSRLYRAHFSSYPLTQMERKYMFLGAIIYK